MHHQQVGIPQTPMQAGHVVVVGQMYGRAEMDAGLGQGLPKTKKEGVGLAVAHYHQAQVGV